MSFFPLLFSPFPLLPRSDHSSFLLDSKSTSYWVEVLSKLLLPRSLKDGSRTNLVVGVLLDLPIIIAHLLNTAIDELQPTTMGPSKLLERVIVIVDLLDVLLPKELKELVVASSFPQAPSFGKHKNLQSFEGNTIQLLTSHFGIIRFNHGSLEEFIYSGLILLQYVKLLLIANDPSDADAAVLSSQEGPNASFFDHASASGDDRAYDGLVGSRSSPPRGEIVGEST